MVVVKLQQVLLPLIQQVVRDCSETPNFTNDARNVKLVLELFVCKSLQLLELLIFSSVTTEFKSSTPPILMLESVSFS